jgi:DNA repair exonuclease SbcCD ATPase subunit
MDAPDLQGLSGHGEEAHGGSDDSIEARLEKLDKRLSDKDSFIEQLKSENQLLREGQSKLSGSIETLATLSQSKAQGSTTDEPDLLEELAKQVEDQEFVDSVDATPSKGMKLLVQALAKERGEMRKLLQKNWAALGGRDEALLERVEKELPLRREMAAYSEAISELRQDPEFAELSDMQLFKIAKKSGAQPAEHAESGGFDGPMMGTRKPAGPSSASPAMKAQAFQIGMEMHFGDRQKATKFVERWLKERNLK